MRSFCLADLVEEELMFHNKSDIKIDLNLSGDILIRGDEHLIKTLLKTALTNALSYAQYSVNISLECKGGWAELKIKDDGLTIPENQSDPGTEIMEMIMKMHHGTFAIKNSSTGVEVIFGFLPL